MNKRYTILFTLTFTFYVSIMAMNDSSPPTFEKLNFKREGGGSKEFFVKADSSGQLHFTITHYNFRDTNYTFSTFMDDSGKTIALLTKLLDGKIPFVGNYKKPTLPTGTRLTISLVTKDAQSYQITNPELRKELRIFEDIVEKHHSIHK